MEKPTLESFMKTAFEAGHIDFHARVYLGDGKVRFYIHEQGRSSQTLDFEVNGNELALKAST